MATLALTTVKERLGHLNVDEAVETVKALGRGSYGVVVEIRVRGLRSVLYRTKFINLGCWLQLRTLPNVLLCHIAYH